MISIQQLVFQYSAAQPLFDRFDLQLNRGELFGLVGPNGAGKSTLISLICGLLTPHSGQIKIDGLDINNNRKEILKRLAVVPQEYSFYPKLTAIENLKFFASLYPGLEDKQGAIDRAIQLTGIESFAKRLAKSYSGGMKRRLNMAIGLLNKPDLLILDEPTVGIDPQSRHFILQAIREINEQGTTVLYTSHYMEEIEQLCHRVAIMDHGCILSSGSLEDILGHHARLKIRLGQPSDSDKQKIQQVCTEFSLQQTNNILVGEKFDTEHVQNIITRLNESGLAVEYVEYGKQSLESLFFELTDTRLRES